MKSEIDGDVILMFRLGDFYEMFFDDAVEAAPILGVTLTKRSGYPMCGVPYHALDSYLAKLIRANRKIAICDQMEDPAAAKGIVRREVTRIVTPGTVTEEEVLTADQHAFLAAIKSSGGLRASVSGRDAAATFGIALLDLSTGTFLLEEHDSLNGVRDCLRRNAVKEVAVAV